MIQRNAPNGADLDADAAAWVVRLADDGAGEADWLAFLAWLDAAPAAQPHLRRAAFDRAQAVWLEADGLADAGPAAIPRRSWRPGVGMGVGGARRRPQLGLAAAAVVAACVAVGGAWFAARLAPNPGAPAASARSYATAAGQTRSIRLADGSVIAMDGATALDVAGRGPERRVALNRGEASFDVVHDPARPFVVALGDAQVRVLGTAFDIVREDGAVQVGVARGAVSLQTAGRSVRLSAGHGARLTPDGTLQLQAIPVADVGAWRQGRRLYWNRPMSQVVADLNRLYPQPIRLGDARAARLRFTGVLVLGPRAEMVRRLTALEPLDAHAGKDGEVVLSSRRP